MQIRHPSKRDLPILIDLWEESFGRDPFCAAFFEKLFCPEHSLVADVGGVPIGMVHTVFYELVREKNESSLRGAYLYAAATRKQYRGLGVFSQLQKALFDTLNADFFFLIPETEKLWSFYRKFGYQDAFFTQYQRILCEEKRLEKPLPELYGEYLGALKRPFVKLDYESFALTLSDKKIVRFPGDPAPFYIATESGYTSFFPGKDDVEKKPSALACTFGKTLPQEIILPFLLN